MEIEISDKVVKVVRVVLLLASIAIIFWGVVIEAMFKNNMDTAIPLMTIGLCLAILYMMAYTFSVK